MILWKTKERTGEEGIALVTTLLVVLVTGALVTGAMILGSNHLLLDRVWARQSVLAGLADAGLEVARSYLNADRSLFPDSGYVTFENGVDVQDGSGRTIPGVHRWTYLGPIRSNPGQQGPFGSIVSLVKDGGGGVAIRRQQVLQESFARFAYFTDSEGDDALFAENQHIWGPLHSNGQIRIHGSRGTFHGEVTTATDIHQPRNGTFHEGYREHTPVIPMPEPADLAKVREQARAGHTYIVGDGNGGDGEATTRIEFVAVDLNGDGDERDEGEGCRHREGDSNKGGQGPAETGHAQGRG